jgi:hypothetical protein
MEGFANEIKTKEKPLARDRASVPLCNVALPVYGAVIIHPIVSPDFNFRKEIQATASESPFFGFEFGFLGWDESNSAGIEPGMKPS